MWLTTQCKCNPTGFNKEKMKSFLWSWSSQLHLKCLWYKERYILNCDRAACYGKPHLVYTFWNGLITSTPLKDFQTFKHFAAIKNKFFVGVKENIDMVINTLLNSLYKVFNFTNKTNWISDQNINHNNNNNIIIFI